MEKIHNLTISFNGETYKKRSKDIEQTILSLKPEVLYTELYFTISKGSGKFKELTERKLNLIQARKLFQDDFFRQVFINNLLLQ